MRIRVAVVKADMMLFRRSMNEVLVQEKGKGKSPEIQDPYIDRIQYDDTCAVIEQQTHTFFKNHIGKTLLPQFPRRVTRFECLDTADDGQDRGGRFKCDHQDGKKVIHCCSRTVDNGK